MVTKRQSAFLEKYRQLGKRRYVFGINEYADAVARVIEVDGYIDQFTNETQYNGKPIVSLADVPKKSLVISVVTNSRPKMAMEKILASGIEECIDYFALADESDGLIPQLTCVSGMRVDHMAHEQEYLWVRSLFADSESLQTYDQVLEFRLNGALRALERFEFRVEQQYFEPFLNLSAGEVFVDGGGYDGVTTLEFSRRCPNYRSVHFFEPSPRNLNLAKRALSTLRDVHYHQLGLFDRSDTLNFDSADGSASRISDSGDEKIVVDALDNVVKEKVTLIKLDLEGAEVAALRGMREHILNDHPKLAVAVYHRASDFRDVPAYVMGVRDDYDVYLRHYTEGWAETIMFFIPRSEA